MESSTARHVLLGPDIQNEPDRLSIRLTSFCLQRNKGLLLFGKDPRDDIDQDILPLVPRCLKSFHDPVS